MSMDALAKLVAQAAPLLGGVLGGPAGAAIGSIVASKFGGDVNNPADLLQKIQGDPQSAVKLLEIQSTNQVELERLHMQMADNALKYESMDKSTAYLDRNSAREREIQLARSGQRDYTSSTLAYLLTFGVFTALSYLFINEVPDENKEVIVTIISSMMTVWVTAMGFYFGSTSTAKQKDLNAPK